ncbi:hypothetical protein FI667_g3319, partial [Globisporangium splendens]
MHPVAQTRLHSRNRRKQLTAARRNWIRHGSAVLPLRSVLRTERLGGESGARNSRVECRAGTEAETGNGVQDVFCYHEIRLVPDAHGYYPLAATFAHDKNTRSRYREAQKRKKAALVDSDMEMRPLLAPTLPLFTSTVYYREQRNGTIFAYNNQDNSVVELERSTEYARFVGMTLHQRTQRLYRSDSRSIKSANVDGSDTTIVIGTLVRVTWIGVNFGSTQSDLLELIVADTRCVSVLSWSFDRVECLVGLPQKYPSSPDVAAAFVKDDDCWIRTTRGTMQGTAPNYGEMQAAGYESPIVERIELRATFILPHALAVNDVHSSIRVNDQELEDWLYWSNSADGTIYRSSLRTTKIDIVHEHAWSVRGLALGTIGNEHDLANPHLDDAIVAISFWCATGAANRFGLAARARN